MGTWTRRGGVGVGVGLVACHVVAARGRGHGGQKDGKDDDGGGCFVTVMLLLLWWCCYLPKKGGKKGSNGAATQRVLPRIIACYRRLLLVTVVYCYRVWACYLR